MAPYPAATRRDVRARARRLLLGGRGSRPARAAVSAGDPRAAWPEGHLLRRPALLALSRGSAPRRGRRRHRRGRAGDRASPAPRMAHRSALPRSPGVRGAPAAPVRCRGAGSAGARGPTHPVRRGRVGDLRIPRRDMGREPRHAACARGRRHPLRLQPERLHRGVLHVTACTFSELALALEHAHAQGWFSVVIVFHCFEFVRVAELGRPGGRVGPQRLLARRFERLCRYLSRHRDRFQTSSFAELGSVPATPMGQSPARSNRVRTLTRQASQLLSRVL